MGHALAFKSQIIDFQFSQSQSVALIQRPHDGHRHCRRTPQTHGPGQIGIDLDLHVSIDQSKSFQDARSRFFERLTAFRIHFHVVLNAPAWNR